MSFCKFTMGLNLNETETIEKSRLVIFDIMYIFFLSTNTEKVCGYTLNERVITDKLTRNT